MQLLSVDAVALLMMSLAAASLQVWVRTSRAGPDTDESTAGAGLRLAGNISRPRLSHHILLAPAPLSPQVQYGGWREGGVLSAEASPIIMPWLHVLVTPLCR